MALLFAATARSAGKELRPRPAGGWEGFGKGSQVKLKLINAHVGKVPHVTIMEGVITGIKKSTLKVKWTTRNIALTRSQDQVLNRTGLAQPGETAKSGKPVDDMVRVGKRDVLCIKKRTVVTGPAGKRAITEWIAKKPRVVVRLVTTLTKKGKAIQTETFHLTKLNAKRTVAERVVVCRQYKVTRKYPGGGVEKGEAFLSRDVPGGTVLIETVLTEKGKDVRTQRISCMAFTVK